MTSWVLQRIDPALWPARGLPVTPGRRPARSVRRGR